MTHYPCNSVLLYILYNISFHALTGFWRSDEISIMGVGGGFCQGGEEGSVRHHWAISRGAFAPKNWRCVRGKKCWIMTLWVCGHGAMLFRTCHPPTCAIRACPYSTGTYWGWHTYIVYSMFYSIFWSGGLSDPSRGLSEPILTRVGDYLNQSVLLKTIPVIFHKCDMTNDMIDTLIDTWHDTLPL